MPKAPILICVDSREQKPWKFDLEEKKSGHIQILGSEVCCLDAADYAIKDAEDLVRIERKQGFQELFNNLMNKENKERFERELEKLKDIKYKYIIIETNLSQDIMGLSLPQYKFGPPVSKITSTLLQYQIDYGIIPIFAGDCGKRIASQIFKTIAKKHL